MTCTSERWPDGVYVSDVYVDHDPQGHPDIHLHCTVTIRGERLTIDFTGSDTRPEIQAYSSFGNTRGYVVAQLASMMDPTIPKNEGFFRAIELVVPAGCCLNPPPGRSVAAGTHHPGTEVGEAIALALAGVIPERCCPQIYKIGMPTVIFGTHPRSGGLFIDNSADTIAAHCNAVRGCDGWGSMNVSFGNLIRATAEICTYAYYPMSTGYESGGFGLVHLDGTATERSKTAGAIARLVGEHSRLFLEARPVTAQVAVVYNPLSHFVGGRQRPTAYGGPQGEVAGIERDSLLGIYRALFPTNVPLDFVHADHLTAKDLAPYLLVVLPYPLMLRERTAAELQDYVRAGGALVLEARAGWNDERGRAADVIPGLGLAEVVGAREADVQTVEKGKAALRELFKALLPLKMGWASQVTVNFSRDPELMRLAQESGCYGVFIGFESVSNKSIRDAGKGVNQPDEYLRDVGRIHQAGIKVWGSFIFGFDNDTLDIFRETLHFIEKSKMEFAQFSLLTPLPGTALFRQFEEEQRIVSRDWAKYDLGSIVFRHPSLTPQRIHFEKNHAWRRFYSIRSILKRLGMPKTRGDLVLWISNLAVNGALRYRWGKDYWTWKEADSGVLPQPLPLCPRPVVKVAKSGRLVRVVSSGG